MRTRSRLDLQSKLEELLGSRNVYYQPPEATKMEYPAIRYSKSPDIVRHASDMVYLSFNRYEIIVISKKPDHEVIEILRDMPYCSHDRHYVSSGLHHDVLTLYF